MTKLDVTQILDTAGTLTHNVPATDPFPTQLTLPSQAAEDLLNTLTHPGTFPTAPTLPSDTAQELWDLVTHTPTLPDHLTPPAQLTDPLAGALVQLDAAMSGDHFTLPVISSSHDFMFQ